MSPRRHMGREELAAEKRRLYDLDREESGRVPRGRMLEDDEHEFVEVPDRAPPGWARSEP